MKFEQRTPVCGSRKKVFLNKEQRDKIQELKQYGKTPKEIAIMFNTTPRHIRDVLRSLNPNITKDFTEEEEKLLIELCQNGNYKEWELKKNFFQNKMPYMIRNKIKTLRSKGILQIAQPMKIEYPTIDFFNDFYDFQFD